MIKEWGLRIIFLLIISVIGSGDLFALNKYYKVPPQFHMYPDPNVPRYPIKRFGPVGIGLDLRRPNFTMHIVNVEKGSPAEACGKLKSGQIIVSINGQTLKDEDPRVLLGRWITEAEAKDGIMKMMVKDDEKSPVKEIIVTIPILGSYGSDWPLNCKKSDAIVRNYADYLAKNKKSIAINLDASLLFMLSTGEEKDLEVARKWVVDLVAKNKDSKQLNSYPWFVGYSGTGLCEYYLRTGDKSVIPIIEKLADYLKRTIYNGSWMGRGSANYKYMGGGHMNAAGVHCLNFLLMAKECGARVDEHTLQSCLLHFYRFAGRGTVSYGDGLPEGGTDNGRNTGLAFAMQSASNLHPDGEKSVYAKARDISATKGFYSTNWLFHGHTGGGIGEFWRGQSMGLIKDKRPLQYRTFMKDRLWMYELARTHDSIFGWVSGWNVSYDSTVMGKQGWGSWIPMIYTLPRKNLRQHGAPKSKYSKSYKIPDRPWGNATDDEFYSLIPGEYKPGKRQDISKERLITDGSMPILNRLSDPDISDDTLLMYAHHIEMRSANAINKHGRDHLIVPLLKSKDPRARLTGLTCITMKNSSKSTGLPNEKLTDEMFTLAAKMINDPNESWWVAHAAMNALSKARPELVVPHVKRLLVWLDHEDWWLRNAAIAALTPISTDKKFYKEILSKIGAKVRVDHRGKVPLGGIVKQLQSADSAVQAFAVKVFSTSYSAFPKGLEKYVPGGQNLDNNIPLLLESIAGSLVGIEGGYDELYRIAPERFPNEKLPHKNLFFEAKFSQFGPELKKAFVPTILNDMIPAYVEKNRKNLEREIASGIAGGAVNGLVALYKKAGINDYGWKHYGPARDTIDWDYLTFEPPEKKIWEPNHRFRKVTLPKGSENWFALDFNPKKAGWKTGRAPFANLSGKLAPIGNCKATGEHTFCGCGEPPNTFWDKEALLMRAEIKLPALKEGFSYRLLVGGRSHYNAGGGTDVWIDGEHLKHQRRGWATIPAGSGRHSWRPWGVNINNTQREHFTDGKILLATNGFLRWGHRFNAIKSYKSFWFEVMKFPPVPTAKP